MLVIGEIVGSRSETDRAVRGGFSTPLLPDQIAKLLSAVNHQRRTDGGVGQRERSNVVRRGPNPTKATMKGGRMTPQQEPGERTRHAKTTEPTVPWNNYVALGDSFTEGLEDQDAAGRMLGWADRLASDLAARNPKLRYANLAVRGKLLDQILATQLGEAIALSPDLVSIAAGGNDILRPFSDPDALAERFDAAVARLRAAGSEVLIGTGFDTRETPVMKLVRGKVGAYNSHLWSIAQRRECYVVDLWSMHVLRDRRAWSEDRLHLSTQGHRRVALCAAETLGLEVAEDWRDPWRAESSSTRRRSEDLRWLRDHVAPWLGRRLRGTSSGDGREPKRPELLPVR